MTTPQSALQELREALRSPVPTVDDFVFHLSSTLDALGIQQGKVVGAVAVGGSGAVKAIGRSMGSIQQALLHTAVPTFLHALDDRGRELLDTFFAPRPASQSATDAAIRTHIALAAYQTFSAQLSARPGLAPLPLVSRTYVLDVLDSLARNYRLEEIYGAIWSRVKDGAESSKEACSKQLMWEDMVRVLVSLPAKVGNVVGQWNVERWKGDIPERLQPKVYFDHLIAELEGLMHAEQAGEDGPARLRLLIERLAAVGLLVPKAIQTPSNAPSLLASLLPRLLSRLQYSQDPYKPGCLPKLFLSLPNSALNPFVDSLLSHLVLHMDHPPSIEPNATDNRILTGLHVLELLIGPAKVDAEAWDAVMASVASRKVLTRPTDTAEHARNRIIVSWVANGGEKALISFADTLLDKWTDAKWIRFSSFSSQFWVTHLVLLVLGRLRPYHPYLASTSTSGRFLMACQSYLAHPDGAVRRMGMLVAESLSASTIPDGPAKEEKDDTEELMKGLDLEGGAAKSTKPSGPRRLKFGGSMWDGQGEGREEARWLRSCIGLKDGGGDLPPIGSPEWMLGWHRVEEPTSGPGRGRSPSPRPYRPRPKTPEQRTKTKTKTKAKPKVVMLDEDDGMSGYSSPSASSSRSASPTPSYLEEVANDPTLALESTDKKKVQRPVYVPQLLALLRDKDNPDAIEMALSHGEALIRAKRSFGTEVTDSAVNLVSQLVGMNDPYNLDDFDTRRDALTRAVVACAPRQTAPYLAEQYFSNQYSLQQRSVMLTALAMAARELAGLHIPDPAPHTRRIDFPSKTLPIALHRQYISPADQVPQLANRQMNQIDMVSDEIRGILLSKGARRAEEVVPDIARQKKLRVGPTKSHAVAEEGSLAARQMAAAQVARAPKPVVPFGDVAAEFFILPLINLFWQHYQDTTARESRALASGTNYRGAGAGMILSPVALERFLLALGLLVHAARHAGVFLSVIVPETLELAVTIGSIHFTRPDDFMLEEAHAAHDGSKAEGQVVGPALELALVCLEGAMDMDQGRTLAMDKPELVMAAGEWAQGVFEVESRGGKVAQGQAREGKIKAAAAGVVIKVADIAEKWTRAGIFMRQ